MLLGCIHINMSTSPALHELGQTRVCMYFNGGCSYTYEYGLLVNITRTSSFCACHVFI